MVRLISPVRFVSQDTVFSFDQRQPRMDPHVVAVLLIATGDTGDVDWDSTDILTVPLLRHLYGSQWFSGGRLRSASALRPPATPHVDALRTEKSDFVGLAGCSIELDPSTIEL